jgi:hypothetical protein
MMGSRPRHNLRSLCVFQYVIALFGLFLIRSESFLVSKSLQVSFSSLANGRQPVEETPSFGRNSTVLLHQKSIQQRKPHKNRRPRGYWSNITNLELELEQFWKQRKIHHDFVLIPSESILYFYNRHDLRGAIASLGGREVIASIYPNTRIMPGRWADAVAQYPQLIAADPQLSSRRTPWNTQSDDTPRWEHSETRREKGYWNITSVFKEL